MQLRNWRKKAEELRDAAHQSAIQTTITQGGYGIDPFAVIDAMPVRDAIKAECERLIAAWEYELKALGIEVNDALDQTEKPELMGYALFKGNQQIGKAHSTEEAAMVEAHEHGAVGRWRHGKFLFDGFRIWPHSNNPGPRGFPAPYGDTGRGKRMTWTESIVHLLVGAALAAAILWADGIIEITIN